MGVCFKLQKVIEFIRNKEENRKKQIEEYLNFKRKINEKTIKGWKLGSEKLQMQ